MVRWNTKKVKTEEPGTIVAYEPPTKFWVEYRDLKDDYGYHTFPEDLLESNAPSWTFISDEKYANQVGHNFIDSAGGNSH